MAGRRTALCSSALLLCTLCAVLVRQSWSKSAGFHLREHKQAERQAVEISGEFTFPGRLTLARQGARIPHISAPKEHASAELLQHGLPSLASTRQRPNAYDWLQDSQSEVPVVAEVVAWTSGVDEPYLGPSAAACGDPVLWQGPSAGKSACEARCGSHPTCRFYSIWLSGDKNWCRLTAKCETITYRQDKTIQVEIYRRREHSDGSCVRNQAIPECRAGLYRPKCSTLTQDMCTGPAHKKKFPCCTWSAPDQQGQLFQVDADQVMMLSQIESGHASQAVEKRRSRGPLKLLEARETPGAQGVAAQIVSPQLAGRAPSALVQLSGNRFSSEPHFEDKSGNHSAYDSISARMQQFQEEVSENQLRKLQALDTGRTELEELIAVWQQRNAKLEEDNLRITTDIQTIERHIMQQRRNADRLRQRYHQLRQDLMAIQVNLATIGEFTARSMVVLQNFTSLPDVAELSQSLEAEIVQRSSNISGGIAVVDPLGLMQVNTTNYDTPQSMLRSIHLAMEALTRLNHQQAVELRNQFAAAMQVEQARTNKLMLAQKQLNTSRGEVMTIERRLEAALQYLEDVTRRLADQESALRLYARRLGMRPMPVNSVAILSALRQARERRDGGDEDGHVTHLDARSFISVGTEPDAFDAALGNQSNASTSAFSDVA